MENRSGCVNKAWEVSVDLTSEKIDVIVSVVVDLIVKVGCRDDDG